ncbi:MAG: hypothetical protein HQK96_08035 [Nitrospirae bacterium]|nr:hypothetical protein [Nitrospirota bacterium]
MKYLIEVPGEANRELVSYPTLNIAAIKKGITARGGTVTVIDDTPDAIPRAIRTPYTSYEDTAPKYSWTPSGRPPSRRTEIYNSPPIRKKPKEPDLLNAFSGQGIQELRISALKKASGTS